VKKIKVIIADDHPLFRKGLEDVLKENQSIAAIAHACNGKEVLALLKENAFQLIFMDIRMPELDGIETTKIVVERFPKVKIVALTMMDDRKNIMAMFRVGVNGYLLKDADMEEINEAIQQVMEGNKYFSRTVSQMLLSKMTELKTIKRAGPYKDELTRREKEIVTLVCQGYSSKEIGELLNIAEKTVQWHRQNIYARTETKNQAQLIMYALDNGLVSGR